MDSRSSSQTKPPSEFHLDIGDVEEAIQSIKTINSWIQMTSESWNTVDPIGVEELVDEGEFPNRNKAIRAAVRELLD